MSDHKKPGEGVYIFQDDINKFFKSLLDEADKLGRSDYPLLDISETADTLKIEIEVPGIEKEDINIELEGNSLVIEGTKNDPENSAKVNHICMERRFGFFRRTIVLPCLGDSSNIKASHNNGMIIIILPKISDRRGSAKKIEVE